jgi:hypothetical protein
MTKKQSESLVQDRRRGKRGKHILDSKIDFSDIPELTDTQLKSVRKVGRPKSKVLND